VSEQKPHLTITEAAKAIGVSRPTLYKAIETGSLRAWRTWSRGNLRIKREELDAWTQRSATENTSAA
jgi:excisionase family DNA binding protein